MNPQKNHYRFEISNGDKKLFGSSSITKNDLIDYYQTIAPFMLPYCENRPVSMQRFPHGIDHKSFFQKNADDYFPTWIKRATVPTQNNKPVHYVVIDKPETLAYLANQDCITPHIWLSRIDKLDKPDRMIFDLDPSKHLSFAAIQHTAKKLKKILDELELPTFCMLTGSRGAHIIVPLKRTHTFEETRTFAHDIAQLLAHTYPDDITVNVPKNKRGNRIFIDWLRNGFGSTAVAPYAVRAYEKAPVATPVTWQELLSPHMHSQKYIIKNIHKRIATVGDIWKDMKKHAVSLTKARNRLDTIIKETYK